MDGEKGCDGEKGDKGGKGHKGMIGNKGEKGDNGTAGEPVRSTIVRIHSAPYWNLWLYSILIFLLTILL